MSKTVEKTWESINDNKKVIGKPCTETQLYTILKFGCYYEGVSSPQGFLDVHDASNIIRGLIEKEKAGKLVKRVKPYNPDQVLHIFYRTYPTFADDIMNRDI